MSSVVAVKGRLSQDMQNERSSPCLKICTWWGEGSRRAERQETGIHPCTCIALAQLHLKPDFYQNQENLEISAATHNCANLIQGISGMPTNTVTRPPAALQMCLGRVQEMWNPWKKSGTITFFWCQCFGRKLLPVCFNLSYLNSMGRNAVLLYEALWNIPVYICTQIYVSTDVGKLTEVW